MDRRPGMNARSYYLNLVIRANVRRDPNPNPCSFPVVSGGDDVASCERRKFGS